jgi:selenocysteine-specific elongation factor
VKVIGTAGHIDHGKSTLVRRLTGIDPDRLDEEKRRGMTIDLGFAWLTLPSGIEVSIVDVPGHERFVKNMLAGAGGVDVALLVIAADEGVMPQTREHLDILDLLAVDAGVVALSKIDLVDDEWVEMVAGDIDELLNDTSLAGSPIVPVSSPSGRGIADLLDALERVVAVRPDRTDRANPFLPIDRVFTVAGFGTVVTGTLHDGGLQAGQEVEIVPRRRRARVRGLQSHRSNVTRVEPGSRVAANLAGVSHDEIERGDVVALPGRLEAVRRFDARLRVVPGAAAPVIHGMGVTVHVGAAERAAKLTVLGQERLDPGEEGWVQLRCGEPVAAVRGQRFIVRLPAPARTVAGGEIVDIRPAHRRFDTAALARLRSLREGSPGDAVLAAVTGRRGRRLDEIVAATGLQREVVSAIVAELALKGKLVPAGDVYLSMSAWSDIRERATRALSAYHAANPMRRGMPREQLRSVLGRKPAEWPEVLRRLVADSIAREEGAVVASPTHVAGLERRRGEADRLLAVLRANPFSPPSGHDLLESTDAALIEALREGGEIVRVADGLYFARGAYDDAVRTIVELVRSEGGVTVSAVRDAVGTSRKYALALLEHLDSERVTRRVGDVRVPGSKTPACA